uniref:Helicase ATP-binding domain-containing protein n=1 Tax=viral metagenome TaxID=1070528 RepID=A0A6C0DP98_9ZZZZ
MEQINASEDLENLIHEDASIVFNPDCVRKKSNISKSKKEYQIDSPHFSPEILLNDMETHSPKLVALLNKIDEVDREDRRKYGKAFKHFIYSDLKSSSSGAKLLASALEAKGFDCGYNAPLLNPDSHKTQKPVSKSGDDSDDDEDDVDESDDESASSNKRPKKKAEKVWGKIAVKSEEELFRTPYNNFFLLTSRGVFEQSITVKLKKEILGIFNKRPDNIDGKQCRFIIMDSGYKEGIDLFDIKYIHIFEPSLVMADQKQIIGRGTRTCGQKGLDFHPRRGWTLDVFIYDLSIPDELKSSFMDSKTAMELYMKSMNLNFRIIKFADELEKVCVLGSVDYDLNKNIHTFSIPSDDDNTDEEQSQFVYNGGAGIQKKLRIKNLESTAVPQQEIVLPNGIVIGQQPENRMGYAETRHHIAEHFNEFQWEKIKMENLCETEKKGETVGGSQPQLMKYNPTQNFIRHYFTPENPLKGILLWHSVGTGKTCTAIATASSHYERQGYTILWVTRSTLKSDIWKNMFEQVCSETIREKIINENLEIPADNKTRMRLLSKAWSIRPMSYKQFSNLVSKKNDLYKALVKKNGEVDPLHKTLLIIDEAHKLYGGDLSSLERPDMPEFHKAVMNSYQISGKDSVKLLMMTATPITDSPMEMMQLLNLCKLPEEQFPVDFDSFSTEYLDDNGGFSKEGREKYLDQIAGHISYLNREKDARQFAQPVIHDIQAPITENISEIKKMDKGFAKEQFNAEVIELQKQLDEEEKEISEDLKTVDKATFNELKDQCKEETIPKIKTKCNKLVREHVRKLIKDIKAELTEIKNNIKKTRKEIQNRKQLKIEALANITENKKDSPEEFEKFKQTSYYTLKSKCGKKINSISELRKSLGENPIFVGLDNEINRLEELIVQQKQSLTNNMASYQKRIDEIKKLFKIYDLNTLEKQVVRSTLKSERIKMRKINRSTTKKVNQNIRGFNDQIKDLKRERESEYKELRKTIKNRIKVEKKIEAQNRKETNAVKKALRKQADFREEIKDEKIKGLITNAANEIKSELTEEKERLEGVKKEKEAEKMNKKIAKEELRRTKKAAKQHEQLQKKAQRNAEKEELRKTKKAAKDAEKHQKNLQKEELRRTKKAAREEEQRQKKLNKTRKVKS